MGEILIYEWKGVWPAKGRTVPRTTKDKMEEYDRQGKNSLSLKLVSLDLKRYLRANMPGTVLQDIMA